MAYYVTTHSGKWKRKYMFAGGWTRREVGKEKKLHAFQEPYKRVSLETPPAETPRFYSCL